MKIFCIGRNYADHARELGNKITEDPVVFLKPPTALLKDDQPFYLPDFSKNVHYEGELVFRICKNGKNIEEKFARKYYDAVTFGIDFTARDLQEQLKQKGLPWEISKGFDGSAAIGNFISLDGLDINSIPFHTVKNGQTVQEGNSANMIFPCDHIIAYISRFFTLQKGDLLYTGTPAGVGPVLPGDTLEGYIGDKKLLECKVK